MRYFLFVDLDGVLVDFDRGVKKATGQYPREQSAGRMWSILARTPDFYAGLEWMPDGRELWERVRPLNPVILTGLPRGKWAEPQKRSWCRRELGDSVEVITCMSREKARHAASRTPAGRIPVLVDDRDSIRESWEEMGGLFIHHTEADSSLAALEDLGIVPPLK